ncbi:MULTISPECIES: TetR family transcriptional regulator C-terminal domain-containing protein [Pacificibacter]|uniref:TetR family transcriptional regulator C-terminal domain-containing protein n=1 Tax=Pacificibacter TaxID=1042323 RepID=UPI001C082CBD|nr:MULTISPECIES: TetR family transcriptional regulator C-terminal domain-containing protein [Pacificibacter]MBU2935464.1 TetR family transcriptional regulator C-terminal domain-containing protein [Pacificibacter marinus]MDO6613961.1 TetR family transcriptional regulator C-terminal domain-containing protein [Pacificibacter sp. 1_MG-2023]
MPSKIPRTRIQKKNHETILEAALDVFSRHGFRGATLDQIALASGLSKPNLLYYFPSKVSIHRALLERLMTNWLDPLYKLNANGDPVEEILAYVLRKLDMAREYPRESRLFANEIVQGAPNIADQIEGELKALVDDKAQVIKGWSEAGRIANVDPYHLIFSIWATTQHYADFDAQVRKIIETDGSSHFDDAGVFLNRMFRRMLAPDI